MAQPKPSPGNAHAKRNSWARGNGSYSYRGEPGTEFLCVRKNLIGKSGIARQICRTPIIRELSKLSAWLILHNRLGRGNSQQNRIAEMLKLRAFHRHTDSSKHVKIDLSNETHGGKNYDV